MSKKELENEALWDISFEDDEELLALASLPLASPPTDLDARAKSLAKDWKDADDSPAAMLIVDKVSKILYEYDLERLTTFGCPDDEYSSEAYLIVGSLMSSKILTVDNISETVNTVLVESFSSSYSKSKARYESKSILFLGYDIFSLFEKNPYCKLLVLESGEKS